MMMSDQFKSYNEDFKDCTTCYYNGQQLINMLFNLHKITILVDPIPRKKQDGYYIYFARQVFSYYGGADVTECQVSFNDIGVSAQQVAEASLESVVEQLTSRTLSCQILNHEPNDIKKYETHSNSILYKPMLKYLIEKMEAYSAEGLLIKFFKSKAYQMFFNKDGYYEQDRSIGMLDFERHSNLGYMTKMEEKEGFYV